MLIAKFEIPALYAQVFRAPGGHYRLEWARRSPEFPCGVQSYEMDFASLEQAFRTFGDLVCSELKPESPNGGERRAA